MSLVKMAKHTSSVLVFLVLVMMSSSTFAFNRNDVFDELIKLNTNWDDISLDMWINDFENDPDPGVLIGDKIVYNVTTSKPAFFAFILVGARGGTSVLKPDALELSGITAASDSLIFPTADESSGQLNYIVQAEPLGKETVYLLVSDQPLPSSLFNLDSGSDYVDYGSDLGKVSDLVTRLNGYAGSIKIASMVYQYLVDSDTQFSSRGIRREITQRVEEVEQSASKPEMPSTATTVASDDQASETNSAGLVASQDVTVNKTQIKSSPIVINDINFEYDSDVLTSTGVSQLEILGSDLIDRLANNQLPKVLLTGHTDSTGPEDYNMSLSKKRSAAAKRFLVEELGLPGENIETHGKGESAPLMDNSTNSGRAGNRRVEFEVLL